MKLQHSTLVVFSGLLWLCIGSYLLLLGLTLSFEPLYGTHYYPLHQLLASGFTSSTILGSILVFLAALVGIVKGRFILRKSAQRVIKRLSGLENPLSITKAYSPAYFLLLGFMVLLGMSIKYFQVPSDIRGFVDVAIGSALITGSIFYFTYDKADS